VSSPTWAYFDTSALVKRYVDEPGRREVLRLLRLHECVTSALLPVELRSALRRRTIEGNVDEKRTSEVLKRCAVDRAYWAFVEVSTDVLTSAEQLVSAHPLRTLDALHVASAQLFAARIDAPDMLFVTADARQATATASLGMTVRRIES
jgi:uncharacterized protein